MKLTPRQPWPFKHKRHKNHRQFESYRPFFKITSVKLKAMICMRTVTDIIDDKQTIAKHIMRKYCQAVFAICELRRQSTLPAPSFYVIFYVQF
jgi:hypothetical protein